MIHPEIPWNVITPDMQERAAYAIANWYGVDDTNEEDWKLALIVLEAALEIAP